MNFNNLFHSLLLKQIIIIFFYAEHYYHPHCAMYIIPCEGETKKENKKPFVCFLRLHQIQLRFGLWINKAFSQYKKHLIPKLMNKYTYI